MTRIAAILKCRDIERAMAFYVNVLGATENWGWSGSPDGANPGYRSITLMGCEIHLSSFAGDGAFGTAIYLYVDDLDGVAERLREAAPDAIEYGPVDQDWGRREVYVRDPDNNALRFGAPLAARDRADDR